MRRRPGISGSQNNAENSSAQAYSVRPNVVQPTAAPNNGQSGAPSAAKDPEEVEELAFLGLDVAAIAPLVGCSPTKLSNEFANASGRGRVRQRQFLLDMSDNPEQAALQRHKLAQLRAQEAARGLGIDQVLPSAEPTRLVQSGQTTELAAPNASARAGEAARQRAPAPALQQPDETRWPACVHRK